MRIATTGLGLETFWYFLKKRIKRKMIFHNDVKVYARVPKSDLSLRFHYEFLSFIFTKLPPI